MAVTVEQAKSMVAEFCRTYPAAYQVDYRIRETQEDLYGPQASPQNLGVIYGGFVPGSLDGEGHLHRGRCDFSVARVHSPEEFERALRHALVGHLGLNTFSAEEKRAVLTAIIDARTQEGIDALWDRVHKHYSGVFSGYSFDEAELHKAEEVYAIASEAVPPYSGISLRAGELVVKETCIDRSRPLEARDLSIITKLGARRLREQAKDLPYEQNPAGYGAERPIPFP